ncbi:MAG: hypothetical protein P8Z37_10985 [Acidobacteriota bacterium]
MKRRSCAWLLLCLLAAGSATQLYAREDRWVEIRSSNFTVYSDAGEKNARRVAEEFEKFHAVIRRLIPSLHAVPAVPTIVLAAKNERTLQSLLPQFWSERGKARPSGIFVGGPEKNYVALRINMDDDYRYHVLYHEYVHLLMRLNFPPLPVWLNEGLAECLGNTVIYDTYSIVGQPNPEQLAILRSENPLMEPPGPGLGQLNPIPLQLLNTEPLLSMEELFAVDNESPHYRDESKVPVFYAQSWALTHMLLLGEQRAHTHKLMRYLELLQDGVPEKKARVQALGDLDELERLLDEYILHLAFYSFKVENPLLQDSKEFPSRELSTLELRTLRGDFFVSMQIWDLGEELFVSVLDEDPDNAEALSSLGILYARQNRAEEAARFFIAAAKAGSKSCITHYHAGGAAMQAGNYEMAEASLRRAIELNPRFAPAYSQLAAILSLNMDTVEEGTQLALKAIELEPGVLSHRLALANALLHQKKVDMAIQYAEQVAAAAESSRDREEAARFLSMARGYRDKLPKAEREENSSETGSNTEKTSAVKNGAPIDPGLEREQAREAKEKALAAVENERQRFLKERADAYEQREKLEETYQEVVHEAGTGGSVSLEGFVRGLLCFDPAGIEMTLDTDGSIRRLHVADYYEVLFKAMDHKPEGELKPCSDLLGKKVQVEYIATPGAAFDGEVQSVGIYKAASKEDAPGD